MMVDSLLKGYCPEHIDCLVLKKPISCQSVSLTGKNCLEKMKSLFFSPRNLVKKANGGPEKTLSTIDEEIGIENVNT